MEIVGKLCEHMDNAVYLTLRFSFGNKLKLNAINKRLINKVLHLKQRYRFSTKKKL